MGRRRGRSGIHWMGLAAVLVVTSSCGVKGKPVPPRLRVPEEPRAVRAEVTPEGILLKVRVPQKYTDGRPLKDLALLQVLRAEKPPGECPDCPSPWRTVGEVPYRYPEGSRIPKGIVIYMDADLAPGTYFYRVRAVTQKGVRGRLSPRVVVYWDVPPETVKGLRGRPGDGTVELTWEPVARLSDGRPAQEVVYEVFRGTKGGGVGSKPIHPKPLTRPSYLDKGLQNGLSYTYRVRALRRAGDRWVPGTLSQPVEVVPRDLVSPEPPQGVVAFATKEGIRLVWEGGREPDVIGYHVYMASNPDGPWQRVTQKPVEGIFYEVRGLQPGQWYWFAVTALDDAFPPNESPRSKAAKAKIPKR